VFWTGWGSYNYSDDINNIDKLPADFSEL
jgi:hypothetical protein